MARGFDAVLKDIREGALLTELPAQLQELVAAVRATGKGGTLTLKLDVRPLAKGNSNTMLIRDTVNLSLPEPDRESTVLYATESNDLSRRDPRQPDLPGVRGVVSMPPPADRTGEQR